MGLRGGGVGAGEERVGLRERLPGPGPGGLLLLVLLRLLLLPRLRLLVQLVVAALLLPLVGRLGPPEQRVEALPGAEWALEPLLAPLSF